MVDLGWIAAKLIELENANKPQKRIGKMPTQVTGITLKMEFAGVAAEIHVLDIHTKQEMIATLDDLYALGFEKPKRYFKEQVDIKDQAAIVKAVTLSTKKTNAGKPMYEVVVETESGDKHTVLKLNKSEFRAEDEVWLFKNEKGYLDIQLDFPEPENGKDIPF